MISACDVPRADERWIEYAITDCLHQMRCAQSLEQLDVATRLEVFSVSVSYWESCRMFPETLQRLRDWVQVVGGKLEITIVDKAGKRHEF